MQIWSCSSLPRRYLRKLRPLYYIRRNSICRALLHKTLLRRDQSLGVLEPVLGIVKGLELEDTYHETQIRAPTAVAPDWVPPTIIPLRHTNCVTCVFRRPTRGQQGLRAKYSNKGYAPKILATTSSLLPLLGCAVTPGKKSMYFLGVVVIY